MNNGPESLCEFHVSLESLDRSSSGVTLPLAETPGLYIIHKEDFTERTRFDTLDLGFEKGVIWGETGKSGPS